MTHISVGPTDKPVRRPSLNPCQGDPLPHCSLGNLTLSLSGFLQRPPPIYGEYFTLKVCSMDRWDIKFKVKVDGPEKLSNDIFRGYHSGRCISYRKKNDPKIKHLVGNWNALWGPVRDTFCLRGGKGHLIHGKSSQGTAAAANWLPATERQEPREGGGGSGERRNGFSWEGPITAVSLITLPLPTTDQYLKARKKTISWNCSLFPRWSRLAPRKQ